MVLKERISMCPRVLRSLDCIGRIEDICNDYRMLERVHPLPINDLGLVADERVYSILILGNGFDKRVCAIHEYLKGDHIGSASYSVEELRLK